jgi:hypothetical protein
MKYFLFLVLLIVNFNAIALDKKSDIKWEPIYAFNPGNGTHAYINRKSMVTKTYKGGYSYNTGEILVTMDNPVEITIGGKKITPKSISRRQILECSSAVLVPIMDFYFSEEFPSRDTKPIAVFKFPPPNESGKEIPKKSVMYDALCPSYI